MNDSEWLDLRKMIGQLFMIGIRSEIISSEEEEFIDSNNIGFIILFARNFSTPEQLRRLTGSIHRLGDIPPAIFIDQEGGTIIRLGESGSTVISHMGLAATGRKRNSRKAGEIIGNEMKSLGVDGVFAPVLDVNTNKDNPVIGTRAFSDDPHVVARFGAEFFYGLRKSKVLACGKHFPGHGHTDKDSHLEIPESNIDENFLFETNLLPFRTLIEKGIDSIMTAHVSYPRISDEIATFSPYITRNILRGGLDFNGVLFSDCLEMKAVKENFTSEEIIDRSFNASVDVLSVSHTIALQKEMIDILLEKVRKGRINERRVKESYDRIRDLKSKIKTGSANYRKKVVRLREEIRAEKKIAAESITLLKNDLNIIPFRKGRTLLIIDFKKKIHTANLNDSIQCRRIEMIAEKFFPVLKSIQPGKKHDISEDEKNDIFNSDYVLVMDHSGSGVITEKKTSFIRGILEYRKDSVLVFADNPYVSGYFEDVSTLLLTYGSRDVQIESLFNILTGVSKPGGRLPVSISDKFEFGSGL